MRNLKELIREVTYHAEMHGHRMPRFLVLSSRLAEARCLNCRGLVKVNANPRKGEVDYEGCTDDPCVPDKEVQGLRAAEVC